jgi:hypothetical protein
MKGISLFGCGFYLFFVLLITFWTERNLEWLLSYLKDGEVVDVNAFWCFLIALLAPIAFLGNVVAEIARAAL